MRGAGEILVVSCYELGRQPVAAASAIAALERAGFAPAAQDVSIDKLSPQALSRARLVLISVPMHTALQLGVRVAAKAREAGARVAFFGLYAALNAAHLCERHGDFVMGNVLSDPIDDIFDNPVFQRVNQEVQQGVDRCRHQCRYWGTCGGGYAAKKRGG